MNAPVETSLLAAAPSLKGGALTVGFALAGAADSALGAGRRGCAAPSRSEGGRRLPRRQRRRHGDAVYCGKVDLGQGLRIAIRQIAAEELGIGVDRISYVEGDTALTPDQGRTAGSNGIQRGGMQIRQAAATARKALIELAAQAAQREGRRSRSRPTARCGRRPAARALASPS